jgi:hypothetical protein
VEQTIHGIKKEPWVGPDDRYPGVYCSKCGDAIDADLDALELTDNRIDFLPPLDFVADALAAQLQELRPDADWTMLELPAQAAEHAQFPGGLSAPVRDALARVGRDRLYSHQAEAIEHGLAGRHTVIATPAGSGKSLGLLMPVLNCTRTTALLRARARGARACGCVQYRRARLGRPSLRTSTRRGCRSRRSAV